MYVKANCPKIFKSKIEACPVNADYYRLSNVAFHLQAIQLQTLVVSQTSFPSFCLSPSENALLFDLNLSKHPFLGQVVYLDLQLLHRTLLEHTHFFLCPLLRGHRRDVLSKLAMA